MKPTKEQIETAAKTAVEYTEKQDWPRWVKVSVGIAIAAAAYLAGTMLASCTPTPAQAAQVQSAHAVYHAVTGKPCILHSDK